MVGARSAVLLFMGVVERRWMLGNGSGTVDFDKEVLRKYVEDADPVGEMRLVGSAA